MPIGRTPGRLRRQIARRGHRRPRHFDADAAAVTLMGDSIYVNPMILGYAWQKGWLPLAHESLMRAIELNAVAIENNKTAFEWGRQAAHDPRNCKSGVRPGQVIEFKKRETVEAWWQRRVEFLTATRTPPTPRNTGSSSPRCSRRNRRWARRR
jgi:hypothetical protein